MDMDKDMIPQYFPLYKQTKSLILQKLIDGVWAPGMMLPSELQLGRDFNVSQGTIRKALDELTRENMFVRKQGKGTYVSQHSPSESLSRFYQIHDEQGKKETPESKVISVNRASATQTEMEKLELKQGASVIRIKRVRYLHQKPLVADNISLPVKLFKDIHKIKELPNTLYPLYETKYDVKIIKADEKIRSVSVSDEDAGLLNITLQSPVLQIDRIATALEGIPVEWRVSFLNTENHYYLLKMR